MRINGIGDLQAGDIMISGMSTAPTRALVYVGQLLLREQFRIGRFVAGHAGIVVDGGKIVEAMPDGARIRDITSKDWTPAHAYFRLPDDYPGQHLDAAAIAHAMVGVPYSFMSYAYLGAFLAGYKPQWLINRINRRSCVTSNVRFPNGRLPSSHYITDCLPVEAICSVLVDQAWTLTGKTVVSGTKPQVVTPGMLTQHLWSTEGVVRGGAGLL